MKKDRQLANGYLENALFMVIPKDARQLHAIGHCLGILQTHLLHRNSRLFGRGVLLNASSHDASLAIVSLLDFLKIWLSHLEDCLHDSFGLLSILVAQHLVPFPERRFAMIGHICP